MRVCSRHVPDRNSLPSAPFFFFFFFSTPLFFATVIGEKRGSSSSSSRYGRRERYDSLLREFPGRCKRKREGERVYIERRNARAIGKRISEWKRESYLPAAAASGEITAGRWKQTRSTPGYKCAQCVRLFARDAVVCSGYICACMSDSCLFCFLILK